MCVYHLDFLNPLFKASHRGQYYKTSIIFFAKILMEDYYKQLLILAKEA